MEATQSPEHSSDVDWIASWGDQVKVGDLVKVAKLGGAVRITSLRKFAHNHGPGMSQRPVLVSEDDDGHWYYGAVVQDKTGKEFHLFIQPHEAVFIGLELPDNTGGAEGLAPDGVDE
jgi:hypothetical protein